MLILTRKIEESIMIGDDVVVKVLRIMGGTVKIGIEAPRSIPIYREEIYHQKEKFEANRHSGEKTKSPDKHIRYVSSKAELWLRSEGKDNNDKR
jgi:carbon storage regulator